MKVRRLVNVLKACHGRYYYLLALIAGVIVTSSSAFAEPLNLGTLTLKDAVMMAVRGNPQLRSQELTRVQNKLTLAEAYHEFEPHYSLSGSASYSQSKSAGVSSESRSFNLTPQVTIKTAQGTTYTVDMDNPASDYYNPKLTFSVEQPLLQGAGSNVVLANLYNSLNNEKVNRWTFRDTVTQTIVTVVSNYTALLSAKRNLIIQQRQLAETLKSVRDTEKYIKAGTKSEMDKVQAESQVASVRLSVVTDENQIKTAKQTLLEDLGLPPETQFNIVDKYNIPKVNIPPLHKAIAMALAHSTQYQSALLTRQNEQRSLLLALDAKRWQLGVTATATTGGASSGGDNAGLSSLVNGFNTGKSVSLNLTVPLDVFTIKSQIINAKIALQQNAISIAQTRRNITTQVLNQYRTLKVQRSQIRLALNDEKLKQQVLDNSIKQNKWGRVSQFEVNTNRQSLISSQQGVVSAQISYVNSLETFSNLIGTTLKRWQLTLRY